MRTRFTPSIHIICLVCLTLALSLVSLIPAWATPVTLSDGNSTATLDPMSQNGMNNWTVDGTNYLKQQWFWFRPDSTTPQTSIDTLILETAEFLNGSSNEYHLRFGTSSTFWIDITYELLGDAAGSGHSQLKEGIEITNNSNEGLDFAFFQYSDFDLSQDQDKVTLTNSDPNSFINFNTATQTAENMLLTESISSISPETALGEAAFAPSILDKLTSNTPVNLPFLFFNPDAQTTGDMPGDASFAFQWEGNIGAGGSILITKEKTISAPGTPPNPIPEPSTILLFGTGLLLASLARRKYGRP